MIFDAFEYSLDVGNMSLLLFNPFDLRHLKKYHSLLGHRQLHSPKILGKIGKKTYSPETISEL